MTIGGDEKDDLKPGLGAVSLALRCKDLKLIRLCAAGELHFGKVGTSYNEQRRGR